MMDNFPYIRTLLQIQLDRLVGEVHTIVDIGAFDGVVCSQLARRYPKATVHAIEPCSSEMLRSCASRQRNLTVHEIAISDIDATSKLYTQDGKSSKSNTLYAEDNKLSTMDVPCRTLSTFCRENNIETIDLLMMNCEGAEYRIFGNANSRKVIAKVRVLDLMLHGKSFLFLSKEYAEKKRGINDFLLKSGFRTVYGEPIVDIERMPTGHIRQVWVRE